MLFQFLTVCAILHQCHREANVAQGFPHSVSLNMFTGIWYDSLNGGSAHHIFFSFIGKTNNEKVQTCVSYPSVI